MTVIGKDRPGLVESVAAIVAVQGGNWLESRMCRLGGEFAGILRIHIDVEKEKALLEALKVLETQGLTLVVKSDTIAPVGGGRHLATLEIVGQDRPGIVHEISSALARQSVNVEELTTECSSAPMSGETLFKASAKLLIPEFCNVSELRRDLERIAGDMLVDITFAELKQV